MRAILILLLSFSSFVWAVPEVRDASPEAAEALASTVTVWNTGISASYRSLAEESQSLRQNAESFCQKPDQAGLETLRSQWRDAFSAWHRIQLLNFGPIEQDSRAWQFQFWPDAKNLVARKIQFRLQQAGVTTAADIAAEGVAIQGFPALEFLLFDETFLGQASAERLAPAATCSLMVAISQHLADQAAKLVAEWDGAAGFGSRYQAGDHPFADRRDVLHRTLKAVMAHLEIIKDRKLAAPMGLRGNQQVNGYLAESWRSGGSIANIRANLRGVAGFLVADGEAGMAGYLRQLHLSDLAEKLERRTRAVKDELDDTSDNLRAALETEAGRHQLQRLYIDVELLHQLLAEQIAPALGVRVGFNSNDGD